MRIDFLKMQGLGNDFLVFDAPASIENFRPAPALLQALADRRTGIGFDQALMLEPPRDAAQRAFYRIFNADGSEVEQCGNGARCIAALLYQRSPYLGREFLMGSVGALVHARVAEDGSVSVDMGVPDFDPQAVPIAAQQEQSSYRLWADGMELQIGAVSIGNPHAVLRVDDVATAPVARLGPAIERHADFPQRTNVGFMQAVSRSRLRLRVFERGVGETRACGTGACAAVAVAQRWGLAGEQVSVELPGGTAVVMRDDRGALWLTGPATTVFSGSIDLTSFMGAPQ